jgi:hypothetical protein
VDYLAKMFHSYVMLGFRRWPGTLAPAKMEQTAAWGAAASMNTNENR